jgi:hypothetical protein
MSAMLQRAIAIALVGAAVVYLSWRGWRMWRIAAAIRRSGCGPGCGCG